MAFYDSWEPISVTDDGFVGERRRHRWVLRKFGKSSPSGATSYMMSRFENSGDLARQR